MNKAYRNIENVQKQVKESVNDLLVDNGYFLINENKFGDNQTLLLQWANMEINHVFQLIWDTRERWFDLGEFNRVNGINYINSINIDLFPFTAIGMLLRDSYNEKYVAKIKLKIKEKLNSTKSN